jgi:hypothetical protein
MAELYRNYTKPSGGAVMRDCACGCGLQFRSTPGNQARQWATGCPTQAARRQRYLSKYRAEHREELRVARLQRDSRALDKAQALARFADYKSRRPVAPDRVYAQSCGRFCGACLDIPDRRPEHGCPQCGNPYQAERLQRPSVLVSSAGTVLR